MNAQKSRETPVKVALGRALAKLHLRSKAATYWERKPGAQFDDAKGKTYHDAITGALRRGPLPRIPHSLPRRTA